MPIGKIRAVIQYLEENPAGGGSGSVTWASITGKPAVIAAGADAAAARTAIGAGTPYTLPAATASVIGGVKQAATQANSTATDVAGVVADLNAMLAKLKAAGIMA
ncbi:head fiber protein [Paenibacillus riograndensis]